jgi:hypothetical protein
MYRLCFKILWTDTITIPNMLANSRIVILLFFRTSSFTHLTFLFALFTAWHSECLTSSNNNTLLWTWKKHLKLVVFPLSPLQKILSIFKIFCGSFLKFQVTFHAGSMFIQVWHFLLIPKWEIKQHTHVLNETLLNDHSCYRLLPRQYYADSTVSTLSSSVI